MDVFFADDSSQTKPSRRGMGRLLAVGGLYVPGDEVRYLEDAINETCEKYGVPDGEEFKWSPRRNSWMYSNLKGSSRTDFFREILGHCAGVAAEVSAVIVDRDLPTAAGAAVTPEYTTGLLIRQVDRIAVRRSTTVMLVVDRPGGGRTEEERLLTAALNTLRQGGGHELPRRIALNPLCTTSNFIRLLQAADVVVSCATQFLAGEAQYSPHIFNASVRPLLKVSPIGGTAIALHPETRYANLYHWILGDPVFMERALGHALPDPKYPYLRDANTP
jgi:uncharacterized protein DUF3800